LWLESSAVADDDDGPSGPFSFIRLVDNPSKAAKRLVSTRRAKRGRSHYRARLHGTHLEPEGDRFDCMAGLGARAASRIT
jgi:hypothetical protein